MVTIKTKAKMFGNKGSWYQENNFKCKEKENENVKCKMCSNVTEWTKQFYIIFNISSLESGTNTSTNSSKTDINIMLWKCIWGCIKLLLLLLITFHLFSKLLIQQWNSYVIPCTLSCPFQMVCFWCHISVYDTEKYKLHHHEI